MVLNQTQFANRDSDHIWKYFFCELFLNIYSMLDTAEWTEKSVTIFKSKVSEY